MARIVIVGGGISGASAAAHLARGKCRGVTPESHEILLLERESAVGGKARTLVDGGWQVETGPTAFLADSPTLDTLIADAGLADQRITADESAKRRYLVRRGRPREVPAHPLKFALSGLLGPLALVRMLREPFVARAGEETARAESVWEFARRRLGRQVADRLIGPMVLGIYAGDPHRLSLPAAFPRLAALEREHGSLIRGMLAKKKDGSGGGPSGPAGTLTSFGAGLELLSRTLATTPGVTLRSGATVESIVAKGGATGGWTVSVTDTGGASSGGTERLDADAVILAGEAWAMAPLLNESAPEISRELAAIEFPPVAVVALGFAPPATERIPHGFGALVPRAEGFRILGSLWDGRIFPGRSPDGQLLVRSIYGGAVDPEAGSLPDDDLLALAREELGRLLGITDPPVFHRIVCWPRAIPQYNLGHLERVATIEDHLSQLPGLAIAGNSLKGVAFGKAAESGVRAAESVAAFLGRRRDT